MSFSSIYLCSNHVVTRAQLHHFTDAGRLSVKRAKTVIVSQSGWSRLHPEVESSASDHKLNCHFTTAEILSPHKDTDSSPDRDPVVA